MYFARGIDKEVGRLNDLLSTPAALAKVSHTKEEWNEIAFCCVRKGFVALLHWVLSNGKVPPLSKSPDHYEYNLLHSAVIHGAIPIIDYLLHRYNARSFLNGQSEKKQTPYELALERGRVDVFNAFMRHPSVFMEEITSYRRKTSGFLERIVYQANNALPLQPLVKDLIRKIKLNAFCVDIADGFLENKLRLYPGRWTMEENVQLLNCLKYVGALGFERRVRILLDCGIGAVASSTGTGIVKWDGISAADAAAMGGWYFNRSQEALYAKAWVGNQYLQEDFIEKTFPNETDLANGCLNNLFMGGTSFPDDRDE
ncbi:hypothetical protein BC829DRAFT_242529 [Chytridium lagenaria]|nr:hypothetical protein BC829DRAFT_242529 [Chytridium lagenaria]